MSALVYDIGLHNGGDTGHYLREGSRVVAVDANPVMCVAAEAHFRDYVRTRATDRSSTAAWLNIRVNSNSGCATMCRS